ncbi:MAG TPA: ABC transporter substrate-binding protein [Stellaceae bacterium]|nr:ABC transporter substrate-binding protein [Stellaceae bacterium]
MTKTLAACGLVLALAAGPALAQKSYGPGVTDTTIKLGNTGPYSGPVSAASTVSKSVGAYFDKINAEGGINERKIEFISLDDGYAPPRALEATRRLVESDQVLATVGSVGTPPQFAVRKYMNDRKVPQLFIGSGSSAFVDPQNAPWSIVGSTSYYVEARLLARYFGQTMPDSKVAVLYQNDDFGKDFLRGFKDALPANLKIAAEASYETSDPSVDSQVITLKASGAEIFAVFGTQKFAAQAIRRAREAEWKAKIFVPSVIASIAAVLQPAGIENSKGVITSTIYKDSNDPRLQNDPAVVEYFDWFKKYNTKVDVKDSQAATGGYNDAHMMVAILKQAGDNLTRENIMHLVTSMHDMHLPMLLDGITGNTSPTDYNIFKQMQFQTFNGESWDRVGGVVSE